MLTDDESNYSDEENVEKIVSQAPKRLGEQVKKSNAKKVSKTKKVKNVDKYLRPGTIPQNKIKKIRDKKLKGTLESTSQKYQSAAESAAKAEILLPTQAGFLEAEGIEKTYKFTQNQLSENVDLNTAKKIFNLDLPDFGPYRMNYTRNGRNLLLGGQKGHIATMDVLRMRLTCEFHANDLVRDVTYLHNNTMFAAAQKKYVYIYDSTGAEAHCIRTIPEPRRLEFLPYHFLLSTISGNGLLSYHDVTTGKQIVAHRTKQGLCEAMTQNPWNAVIHLGHTNGLVTLWTPNMSEAVIKMQCHQGPIRSLAIDNSGKYLVTAGADRKVKIFDIRKYQEISQYYLTAGASSISISQRGLVSLGFGPNVHILQNCFTSSSPSIYMKHSVPGSQVSCVRFQPFEDVLSLGHSIGFSNVVVPGAGEPNFDTFEANPFENSRQRNESEVRSLLEKLRPEMITLDPSAIGRVDLDAKEEHESKLLLANRVNNKPVKVKNKMRGRNRPSRRLRKRQQNVVDEQKQKYRDNLEKQKKQAERKQQQEEWMKKVEIAPTALNRFFKKH